MRVVDTAKLRYYMELAGCRYIRDLEKVSGVNRITLAGIMHGKILPSSDVIDRIIVGINIPAKDVGEIFYKHIA